MPVAPGIRPSVTSGVPNWIFAIVEREARMRRERDLPAAAQRGAVEQRDHRPAELSRRRKFAFIASISRKPCAASSAFSFSTSVSSAPAKNVVFADVSSTPLMRSLSASSAIDGCGQIGLPLAVIVLTGEPGASSVSVAMPSASIS